MSLDLKILQNDVMMSDLRKKRRFIAGQIALRTDADTQLAYLVFEFIECAARSQKIPSNEKAARFQEKQLAKAVVLLNKTVAGGLRVRIHLSPVLLARWKAERDDHTSLHDEKKRLKKSGSLHHWM
ncbi:hypothetical protein Hypma_012298 [Hypsizygus marmoreus]|uniref:Uncharacterized protein n=1 Tax=Hypsizygus marmoreus TaxID=39966 RepID=A0A369JHI4_HYPMA|nr:hypothetical protein Hypma_012298 [Hypsizygus marmoreus]